MVKMEGQCQRLLDGLRITVRNLFYQALQPFKKAYDHYRDDHDYFRQLTQSPGVLEVRAEEIVVHLMPRTHYGGELRKAVFRANGQAVGSDGGDISGILAGRVDFDQIALLRHGKSSRRFGELFAWPNFEGRRRGKGNEQPEADAGQERTATARKEAGVAVASKE